MSSATRFESDAGKKAGQLVDLDKLARLGMSPRQQQLNRLWSFYRCANYDARKVDWDGREYMDPIEHEAVARAGFIPPGFYQAQDFPIKFRRPTAPYNLVKVIVDRFTGLLFSERRHPQLRVDGDSATEDVAQALAEAARLWPSMIQARAFGGACGSVCVGFQFSEGRPVVEVHDPRWVQPEFVDRSSMKLKSFEKRYMFPQEERDPATGAWVEIWYWYRRVVDENHDVLWKPVLVGDGAEPHWDNPALIAEAVEHGFGFCPAVWIQNMPVSDDIDGDSDCHGIYDMAESIDALIAQANRGTVANCDPTVVIVTPDEMPQVSKGSGNAIKLTQGSVQYMEISGSGPNAAREMAQELRGMALEVSQCVLENPSNPGGARTATEIERTYASMLAKADVMREQYGERGIKPLMEMMLKAARKSTTARQVNGQIERGSLVLPEKIDKHPDGTVTRAVRKLGPGGSLQLQWPGYFEPSLQDAQSAVQAASAAVSAGLVDKEHASKLVAEHFRVEDVTAMLAAVAEEQQAQANMYAQPSLDSLGETPPEPGAEEPAPEEYPAVDEPEYEDEEPEEPEEEPVAEAAPGVPALPPGGGALKLTPSDLATIVTVNEGRASVGFGPMLLPDGSPDPDGSLTLAAFKAKHEAVVASAASASKGQPSGGAAPMGMPPLGEE